MKKLISSLMAVVLAVGLVPAPARAQETLDLTTANPAQTLSIQAKKKLSNASKKKMRAAYKKVLRQAQAKTGIYAGLGTNESSEYALYDIGNDGIPELFVVGNFTGLGGFVEVYDYASGKARDLGRVYTADGWLYGTSKGKLYCACGRQGGYYAQSIKKSSGKLSVKTPYKTFYAKDYNDWDAALNRMRKWLSGQKAKPLQTKPVTSYSLLNSKIKVTYKMSEAKVSVAASKTYTGKAVKPKVTVKVGGSTLKAGKGYTVTYRNAKGKKVSAPKAVGTYKVTVTGEGNLKGSVTRTFKVVKAAGKNKVALNKKAKAKLVQKARGLAKSSYSVRFRLADLDGDGVSEMLVQKHETESMWSDFLVYAYKSGKVKQLLDRRTYGDWASFKSYKKSKSIVAYGSGHGGEAYCYFKLAGGKCQEVASRSRSNVTGSWSAWSYYKPLGDQGNASISKSEYDVLVANLTKGKAVGIKGPFYWKSA